MQFGFCRQFMVFVPNIYYNKNQKILDNDKTKPNMSPKVAEEIAKKIIEDAKMHRKSRGEDKD